MDQTISILVLELLFCSFLTFVVTDELTGCRASHTMDPVLPVQADEQPMAGSGMEGTPVDPILESLGARQHAGEPIAAVGGLGGGE